MAGVRHGTPAILFIRYLSPVIRNMPKPKGPIVLAAMLALAACSRTDDQPGTVSADEASQLNDAAAMLDANSVDAALLNTQDPAP